MLHGAHGVLELDQQRLPWSINEVGMGQGVAQWAIVVIEARGWRTSIVKRKILENLGTEGVGCTGCTRAQNCTRAQGISPTGCGPKCPRFGLTK